MIEATHILKSKKAGWEFELCEYNPRYFRKKGIDKWSSWSTGSLFEAYKGDEYTITPIHPLNLENI